MATQRYPITAPFSEPILPQLDTRNPYYSDIHHNLRAWVRNYVETYLIPYVADWEAAGQIPDEDRQRYYDHGFGIVHPLTTDEDRAFLSLPANVPPEKWDTWCSLIVGDEIARSGFTGVIWGLGGGNAIGCPPIARFGTTGQRKRWLPAVAKGKIRFCLGITEPDAGSDVANIRTIARRDGDYYIVDGAKKWITNGIWADYCTAAVRTGGSGRKGISVLVIPLKSEGVTCRRMQTSGVHCGGTTYIEFDNVHVPVDHLIGEENKGFSIIMSNFNGERLSLACSSLRLSRICAEDAFNYAVKRETFGAALITRQVVQSKIFDMGVMIEPAYAFMENLVYIIENSKDGPSDVNIGGMTALLKVMASRTLEKCVREAQQIMGGVGYTRSGIGTRVEQISRDVRVQVVGGGSEEILMSLAIQEETKALRVRQKALNKTSSKL